jgi:hypothetical protein
MAYLIDTDIFIAAKNLHYGMDFCPGFWEWLVVANRLAKLISVEAVQDDLVDSGDELAVWAKARAKGFFVAPAEPDLTSLGRVTQWINEHQVYTPAAKQTFLGCSDYFVVSQSLAGGHTIITHEKPENSVHRIKIPSVCVALNVKYMTPWQMLRTERARFVLEQPSAARSAQAAGL